MVVDTQGRMLRVYVYPANVHDQCCRPWVRAGGGGPSLRQAMPETKPLPERWVVERTLAWLGRNRRLSKDYEQHPSVSEAWLYLGMLRLLVKRLARAA
ncbi:hypothetical protein [Thermus caldilimi]|uniref:hypothetical protein n=1 Tax=Thermus caldilimi TaxID=2483360 RepID=UPI003571463C